MEQKEPEVWVCTDPDTKQYGRKISKGVYEFREDINGNEFKLPINLAEYSVEELEGCLLAYGYTLHPLSEDYLFNEYDDENGLFQLAEWLFEFELPMKAVKNM